jgi:hypothetical protein
MTWAAFRTGSKVHTKRPTAGERSARWAWDHLAKRGAIVDMKLIDGLWMCQRPDTELDSVEACVAREQSAA